jgi:hypothetical protein
MWQSRSVAIVESVMPPFIYFDAPAHIAVVADYSPTHGAFASGMAQIPPPVSMTTIPATHPHDQARYQPLEAIEGVTVVLTLGLFASVKFVRHSIGQHGVAGATIEDIGPSG